MSRPDIKRVIVIVLDSVGVGELPDADAYGDAGSNTLAHTAEAVGGLELPNLATLGLGNIIDIKGVPAVSSPGANYGKMAEQSAGKDTTTGHWEIAGIVTTKPFPTYPNGFPPEVIGPFEQAIGRGILANYPASGTEIIKELGREHIETGKPIVYTSADSVFQIAAHEDVVPIEQLYEWCRIARQILIEPHNVTRVIARPFIGTPGNFTRTERRRDFSLHPPGRTILDAVNESGREVIAVGKIHDIFADKGISKSIHTTNNREGIRVTTDLMRGGQGALIFANLVDFDMLYGHRNDPVGYSNALKEFDEHLPVLMDSMQQDDILIITADHGCDPTTESTDHSREYVPLIVYGPSIKSGVALGIRTSFCDVAASIAGLLKIPDFECGKSFYHDISITNNIG